MNEYPIQPGGPDLPPDLRHIAEALDQLGALDRALPGASFERRMAATTAPGSALDPARLSALAEAERQAAPGTLEDRIFVATRSLLRTPAETPAHPLRIHTPRRVWMARAAASLTLVATAALTYIAMQPALTPDHVPLPRPADAGQIAANQLEDDFADLAVILNVALGSADAESTATNTTPDSLDAATFDLPRFDFLNAELEGSL